MLNLLPMSKKQSKESNEPLRSLGLSTNVNDYDTGQPVDSNLAETVSKKKIGVNKHFEVKTGNKSRP
jgi:hypothetical protein